MWQPVLAAPPLGRPSQSSLSASLGKFQASERDSLKTEVGSNCGSSKGCCLFASACVCSLHRDTEHVPVALIHISFLNLFLFLFSFHHCLCPLGCVSYEEVALVTQLMQPINLLGIASVISPGNAQMGNTGSHISSCSCSECGR